MEDMEQIKCSKCNSNKMYFIKKDRNINSEKNLKMIIVKCAKCGRKIHQFLELEGNLSEYGDEVYYRCRGYYTNDPPYPGG